MNSTKKTGDELRCSGRVSSSYYSRGTHGVTVKRDEQTQYYNRYKILVHEYTWILKSFCHFLGNFQKLFYFQLFVQFDLTRI
jgi:hypothetical protein